eukprot:4855481-Amphidinium_carterae.2
MPRAVKCYHCQRNGTQVLLFECEVSGCNHGVCGIHSHWSAIDEKVRCFQCAPPGHHGPLIRIRGNSSVDLTRWIKLRGRAEDRRGNQKSRLHRSDSESFSPS